MERAAAAGVRVRAADVVHDLDLEAAGVLWTQGPGMAFFCLLC
jgi:hypothetical protein